MIIFHVFYSVWGVKRQFHWISSILFDFVRLYWFDWFENRTHSKIGVRFCSIVKPNRTIGVRLSSIGFLFGSQAFIGFSDNANEIIYSVFAQFMFSYFKVLRSPYGTSIIDSPIGWRLKRTLMNVTNTSSVLTRVSAIPFIERPPRWLRSRLQPPQAAIRNVVQSQKSF